MNRRITGIVVLIAGVLSSYVTYRLSQIDFSEFGLCIFDINPGWMMIATLVGSFLLVLNGIGWIAPVAKDSEGQPLGTLHAIGSELALWLSSLLFGAIMVLMAIQMGWRDVQWFGTVFRDGFGTLEYTLIAMAVLAIVLVFLLRATIRDYDVNEEYGWDLNDSYRVTRWKIILIAMTLPLIVVAVILIIVALFAGKSAVNDLANSDVWTCPSCGAKNRGGGACGRCGYRRYHEAQHRKHTISGGSGRPHRAVICGAHL